MEKARANVLRSAKASEPDLCRPAGTSKPDLPLLPGAPRTNQSSGFALPKLFARARKCPTKKAGRGCPGRLSVLSRTVLAAQKSCGHPRGVQKPQRAGGLGFAHRVYRVG